ncbi:MAG: GGDEF domain-containing protein [Thalassotalea sp.]
MALAIQQLEEWNVPANPINYAISYHYIIGSHHQLIKDIDAYIKLQENLDSFFLEELYRQHVLGQNQFRDDLVNDLEKVMDSVHRQCDDSSASVNKLISGINNNLAGLQSKNKPDITQAISAIYKAATVLKAQQQQVGQEIAETQAQTLLLKAELAEIRKEIYLDPLTGLHNRKALNKQLETWVAEDPEQEISAIVVNVDHFKQLNDKFGSLIGNVLLSKVAKKVTSYVGESGLPVRTATNEFLILLPGVEKYTANEIAEKIRQGVEKLRFVSSKTGVRLPPMTISLGVNQFKARQNVLSFLAKTRILLKKLNLKNQVVLV